MKNKNTKKAKFFKEALADINPNRAKQLEKEYLKKQDKSYYRGKSK